MKNLLVCSLLTLLSLSAMATPDVEAITAAVLKNDSNLDIRRKILAGDFSPLDNQLHRYTLWRMSDFAGYLDLLPVSEREEARGNREIRNAFIAHVSRVDQRTQEWGAQRAAEKYVELHTLTLACEASSPEKTCQGEQARILKEMVLELGSQKHLTREYDSDETSFNGTDISLILASQKMNQYPLMLISNHFANTQRQPAEAVVNVNIPRPSRSFNFPARLVSIEQLDCQEKQQLGPRGKILGVTYECKVEVTP